MNRAVFLDRDGVLLDHGGLIISGIRRQLERLKLDGYLLIVVTNQPDIEAIPLHDIEVKRRDEMNRIHIGLRQALFRSIDDLFVCTRFEEGHDKKPDPGMLLKAAQKHDIDLERSWMVGDRWRDVGAGHNAGCKTILIGTGYGELFPVKPLYRAADMEHAVDIILEAM